MNYKLISKDKFIDQRGSLAEFLTRSELEEGFPFGHIYFVTFEKKGVIRGNHYHAKKDEYFGLAMGKVEITIEDIKTKERKSFILDSEEDKFTRLQIGPNTAHAVESLSDKAVLIDYFPEPYNKEDPDSISYEVVKKE
ncbi:hypothetical protein C4578_02755 [Candidatus Microgenomates bacterium]|jgi:UDP-2-acetamido-2,6-beta-L-arabino-hexul-4-ose reductase|nr:MAG: hypothetical protein C4578_02755 [Candidatus Microgenomates bacterium]